MNCQEFDFFVNDLAHGRLIDAAARNDSLVHAEGCSRCQRRLENERTLSGLLRALAAADEAVDEKRDGRSAAESALLAAYRQQAPSARVDYFGSWMKRARWGAAAALLVLAAIGLAGIGYRRAMRPAVAPVKTVVSGRDKIAAGIELPAGRPAIMRSKQRRERRGTPRSAPILIRDEITLYGDDADVATDFIPLTDNDDYEPIESGELIRVRLPRTSLLKFGLPMNIERAGIPVNADLLVGEDGLAHAIRFVR